MENLNYLMDHILYQIFKITLSISSKSMIKFTDNSPARIYGNKIENRITFTIKTEYYLQFLMPEMMKLFGSNKSKITKDETGENVPRLEITEVHCNVVNNYDYQQDSRVSYIFVPNKSFGQLLDTSPKNFFNLKI